MVQLIENPSQSPSSADTSHSTTLAKLSQIQREKEIRQREIGLYDLNTLYSLLKLIGEEKEFLLPEKPEGKLPTFDIVHRTPYDILVANALQTILYKNPKVAHAINLLLVKSRARIHHTPELTRELKQTLPYIIGFQTLPFEAQRSLFINWIGTIELENRQHTDKITLISGRTK